MTLTVRLDPTLATALDRYCAGTGTTKSHVVQESVAAYSSAPRSRRPRMVRMTWHGPARRTGHLWTPVS